MSPTANPRSHTMLNDKPGSGWATYCSPYPQTFGAGYPIVERI